MLKKYPFDKIIKLLCNQFCNDKVVKGQILL